MNANQRRKDRRAKELIRLGREAAHVIANADAALNRERAVSEQMRQRLEATERKVDEWATDAHSKADVVAAMKRGLRVLEDSHREQLELRDKTGASIEEKNRREVAELCDRLQASLDREKKAQQRIEQLTALHDALGDREANYLERLKELDEHSKAKLRRRLAEKARENTWLRQALGQAAIWFKRMRNGEEVRTEGSVYDRVFLEGEDPGKLMDEMSPPERA